MRRAILFGLALLATDASAAPRGVRGADGWRASGRNGIRGMTIGPIENGYHPGVGYGSRAFERTLEESKALGAEWVSVTPFGRVNDLSGQGVDLTFEAPFHANRAAVRRAIDQAHAHGLRVLLVPHLWVESGQWRGEIDPKSDEGWARWAASYRRFLLEWAKVAEESHADMLSVGVELRSWVTTSRAPSFAAIVRDVRGVYRGLLTYAANWDDVEDTVVLGDLDVIGINAFYPLADKDGASPKDLLDGGLKVRAKVHALAERWKMPVLFTEIGYTTRPNPAVRPWEWPDTMKAVKVDEEAQALAYFALLAPLLDEPHFAGFFVWRIYADPDDVSQEAEWGFSPRGKLAELVVRDAFHASWAADSERRPGWALAAEVPGVWP
jgi:Glycoside Hydrolase Family 113